MSFSDLNLPPEILRAVSEKNYETPSPIQAKAIPVVMDGKDILAAAQTGTGKTAGFTLPLLARLKDGQRAKSNHIRALVLTPTRELAAQVGASVDTYSKYLKLSNAVVFGGVKINPQMMQLRRGVDILVATPGRLMDLYQQNAIKFNQVEILVLDEADRMLDMGFIRDIRRIIDLLPERRQNLMFSATFSDDIKKLANTILNNPVEVSVSPKNSTTELVEQWICPVDKRQKSLLLLDLIQTNQWHQVLVFSRTKHGANKLVKFLSGKAVKSAAIHGNKSQAQRTKALADFKSGKVDVLVATDIAARGLDIDQLPQVVNFDLPNVPEDYVHRIGRTGRAGSKGKAVSLVCADEHKQLLDIERLTKKLLRRELVDGFEPVHDVPPSKPIVKNAPQKNRRPKKTRSEHRSPDYKPAKPRRPASKKPSGEKPNGNSESKPRPARKKPADGARKIRKRPVKN